MQVSVPILAALGAGWLAFLWLLVKRRGGARDLIAPPERPAPRPDLSFYATPPVPGIPPGIEPELRTLVAEGRKIEAIKRLRAATLTSLADAKAMVDRLEAGPG